MEWAIFCCFGGFYIQLETFSLILKRQHYRRRASNFDLYSAPMIMVIDNWGFFSVPNQLWNGAYVYNGHLRGPVTPIPVVTTCFYDLGLSRLWFEHPTFRVWGERSNRLHHRIIFRCKKPKKQTNSITIMWFDKSRMHDLKRKVMY